LRTKYLMLLLIINGFASAQITEGSSIDNLVNSLQEVKNATDKNTKMMEDIPGIIETEFRRQASYVIVGVSIFITLIFSTGLFLLKLRERKNKKTYEEYIKELEERDKDTHLRLVMLTDRAEKILSLYEGKPLNPKEKQWQWRYPILIFSAAMIVLYYVIRGWF